MIRSIGALVAGYLTMALLVIVGSLSVAAVLLPGGIARAAPVTTEYLVANLAVSFAAAVAGGWVAGWLAGERPLRHGAILAAIVLTMGLAAAALAPRAADPAERPPAWYPWAVAAVGSTGTLLGGFLRSAQRRRAAPPG